MSGRRNSPASSGAMRAVRRGVLGGGAVIEHDLHSESCWCDPMTWMLCDECDGLPEGCWKCKQYQRPADDTASAHPTTAGLIPHDGSQRSAIIIHRGSPRSNAFKLGKDKECPPNPPRST